MTGFGFFGGEGQMLLLFASALNGRDTFVDSDLCLVATLSTQTSSSREPKLASQISYQL